MDRVQQMKNIQNDALNLFIKKNTDYGDAFAKYGIIGVLMRIEDKIQRLMSITNNKITLVNDETLKDTLLDFHNYSAMALMLYDPNIDTDIDTNTDKKIITKPQYIFDATLAARV